MKLIRLLPPVIALVIAMAWIGNQRRSISNLERASTILQKAVVARANGSLTDSSLAKQLAAAKSAEDKKPLDWRKIAAELVNFYGYRGISDQRGMMKFERRLQLMSKEELFAALDEIAALDLPKQSRGIPEYKILELLSQKDPEMVLNRFVDRIEDLSGALNGSISEWAKKNPAGAIAWFDQQIAAGKFDSKSLDGISLTRHNFEGIIFPILLGSNPDSAERRLAALPQDQRDDALSALPRGGLLTAENQGAYAKIVRNQLTEEDQIRILAGQAASLVQDESYAKVDEFLDRIVATSSERTACVENAITSKIFAIQFQKKITRKDLDTIRKWVTGQCPDSTGSITGRTLAAVSGPDSRVGFSEAAELVIEYNTATGNDDVLCSFLESSVASQDREQARALAAKISDPKRREETLKNLE